MLPKTKYYQAIGSILNSALARILQDVLALGDITADESQKLSELCKIFNALEGLFVEDPNHVSFNFSFLWITVEPYCSQPSFVVAYVPAWLKFSYLSELLVSAPPNVIFDAVTDRCRRKHLLRIFRIYLKKVPLWTLRSMSSSISCGHSSQTHRYERTRLISSCKDIPFGRSSYSILFYGLYASRYDGSFCCHGRSTSCYDAVEEGARRISPPFRLKRSLLNQRGHYASLWRRIAGNQNCRI